IFKFKYWTFRKRCMKTAVFTSGSLLFIIILGTFSSIAILRPTYAASKVDTIATIKDKLPLIHTTNIANLPKPKDAKQISEEPTPRPFLPVDKAAYDNAKKNGPDSANTGISARIMDKISDKQKAQIQTINTGFDGLRKNGWTPPDVQVAAGPNNILEMVNLDGEIYTKSGSSISSFSLSSFFETGSDRLSDPRVTYDAQNGHWFASILDITTDSVLVAVSSGDDPTGSWNVYYISFDNISHGGNCPDQPVIGMSFDKFVVSANVYGNHCTGSFLGAQYFIIDKIQMALGFPFVDYQFVKPQPAEVSIHPVQSYTSDTTLHMVSAGWYSTSNLELFTISGAVPNAVVTEVLLPITTTFIPPPAVQKDTGDLLETNDARVEDAAMYQNYAWVGLNDSCIPTGDSITRSCIRLIEVDTQTPAILQDFDFGAPKSYYFYPALHIDGANGLGTRNGVGNLNVIFGYSSVTSYPSLAVTGQAIIDSPNSIKTPLTIVSGIDSNHDHRYGDYFGASVDPSSPSVVWLAGQYQSQNCFVFCNSVWATYITSIEQSFVTVSTDKLSYTSGEAVHIGGRASPVITGQSVLIRVLNPNNVLYKQDFAIVNPEGAYTYDLVIGGPLGISGSYTIKAFYNGQVASKSIGFTNTRTPTSLELSPIQSVPWGQKVKVTGILKNTQTGLGLGSKTITFDGSGAFNLSPVTTKPD